MVAKRHMDIKRNITGHNIIIADITGYFLKKLCIRRQVGDLETLYGGLRCEIVEVYKFIRDNYLQHYHSLNST